MKAKALFQVAVESLHRDPKLESPETRTAVQKYFGSRINVDELFRVINGQTQTHSDLIDRAMELNARMHERNNELYKQCSEFQRDADKMRTKNRELVAENKELKERLERATKPIEERMAPLDEPLYDKIGLLPKKRKWGE